MTENKQIETSDSKVMIDGVDVNGCKLYRDEISFVGGEIYTDVCSIWIWQRDYSGLEPSCVMKCHCEDNPNCLFKQLARKTQECEELKERLNSRCFDPKNNNNRCISYNRIAEDYERDLKQLDQLKVENEDLKKQVNDLLNKPEIQDKILWKIDNEALLGSKDAWIYKLEQTLTEIKEIAKNMNKECFYDDFDCKYCDMKNGCTYQMKIKILQKIREVEDVRN